MASQSTSPLLAVALALSSVTQPALGQLGARRALEVTPPRSVVVGQPVMLSVRGAAQGARYRYVATMTATGGSGRGGVGCPNNQSLGSGVRVTWRPASGTYRLTAYGPTGQAETDTLSLAYQVLPRTVMLASSQTPAQPSGVTLVLRTDDLGPGHKYEWWMQYASAVGGGGAGQGVVRSQPWTTVTSGPLATYPTPISASATISARVSIHRGEPCAVVAAGAMGPQQ